ncbi:glycosyltransferase family 4 protein [Gloeobacter kilaueensis]|uniref:Glycosyl transferase group 1 n=1 Tax=Gloeobacter kilaueensis (strain ATCC BAA-2537 / CCAP 1431/1 / ULC 316 / JS1) TaxID=1183438 RepID=U5QIC2_GLOK1|nr:glycosyltransferase family 4 protein [Gloeobacter kilaueensis]AGY58686.1 glycosyl transferase group 1 [Gloeobacter kilaueensis JS1]
MLRLLFVSSALGPLGTGTAGGVEFNVLTLARELTRRGHLVHLIAPEGSRTGEIPLVAAPAGLPPGSAQHTGRTSPVVLPQPSTLANLFEAARARQDDYDLIFNWCYDWLPLYLTPFFRTPLAHMITMGSLLDSIDEEMARVLAAFPGTIAVYTKSQAQTFGPLASKLTILPFGLDPAEYEFCAEPEPWLAWVGRIAPEKGLEDAVAAAAVSGLPLHLLGRMQDSAYFEQVRSRYPQAEVHYRGFFDTDAMQRILRTASGMLFTPKWIEAFGNVAIEAMACGVPVIAYERGGPAETVIDGLTGYLVPPDDVQALVAAIARLPAIDRARCRAHVEAHYSLSALGGRFEEWFFACARSRTGQTSHLTL